MAADSGSSSTGTRNPELQRLLATLNSYVPRAPVQSSAPVTSSSSISGSYENVPQLQLQQQQQQQQQQPYGQNSFDLSTLTNLTSRKRPYEGEPGATSNWQPSLSSSSPALSSSITELGMISSASEAPGLGLGPASAAVRLSSSTPTLTQVHAQAQAQAPIPRPAPIPDASRITTYPAAVKHVTRHLATSDTVSTRIRHMIKTQHEHERQWHKGREALLVQQENRQSTREQVSALLKSLGAATATDSSASGAGAGAGAGMISNEEELKAYDAKVYRSLVAMQADFERQLRNLAVPFFAIAPELVVKDGETPVINTSCLSSPGPGPGPRGDGEGELGGREKGSSNKLDKGELRELQKRMLGLLEDMFGD